MQQFLVTIDVDTDEAREFVTACLGWRWVEWRESQSAALWPDNRVGVWVVEAPCVPPQGVTLVLSGPEDGTWDATEVCVLEEAS